MDTIHIIPYRIDEFKNLTNGKAELANECDDIVITYLGGERLYDSTEPNRRYVMSCCYCNKILT